MLNIDFLKNSWYFKKISLRAGDMLFDEWENNNNLYFIESWQISIEKYMSNNKKETKKLAILSKKEFFWEWALSNPLPKEVSAISLTNTVLLYIDAQKWIEDLIKKYPLEWLVLLKHLINITNHRLLKSNTIVTATYEINKQIVSLEKITIKSIFEIINSIKSIINCDYIIYLEKYEAINNSLILRYNTSKGMTILNKLIDIKNNELTLKNIIEHSSKFNFIQKLNLWDKKLWYLVFCNKNKDFTEGNKKIILSITPSLSWIIRQKEIYYEERDKAFIINN